MSSQTEIKQLVAQPRLRYPPAVQDRFNIDPSGWKALVEAVFNNATSSDSVVLALAYCKARGLDPFKRQCHIVPIYDKTRGRIVDTVWPGIAELRTTAFRTGQYAGRDLTTFGPTIDSKVGNVEVDRPEWAQVTVYRLLNNQRVPFPGPRVYWQEAVARKKNGEPNDMWLKRPFGQLEKCAEAAALRGAFPEEIGNDLAADEVGGWDWHGRLAVAAADSETSDDHIQQAREQRKRTEQELPFNPPSPAEQSAAEGSQVDPDVDAADGVDEPGPPAPLDAYKSPTLPGDVETEEMKAADLTEHYIARVRRLRTRASIEKLSEEVYGMLDAKRYQDYAKVAAERLEMLEKPPAEGEQEELFDTSATATEAGE